MTRILNIELSEKVEATVRIEFCDGQVPSVYAVALPVAVAPLTYKAGGNSGYRVIKNEFRLPEYSEEFTVYPSMVFPDESFSVTSGSEIPGVGPGETMLVLGQGGKITPLSTSASGGTLFVTLPFGTTSLAQDTASNPSRYDYYIYEVSSESLPPLVKGSLTLTYPSTKPQPSPNPQPTVGICKLEWS